MPFKIKMICSSIIVLLFFCPPVSAQEKNNFTLRGTAKGLNGQWIYFSYRGWSKDRQWDSVTVKNDHFLFAGYLAVQWKGFITVKKDNRTNTESGLSLPLFLEPGNMTINLANTRFSDAVLKGSRINDEFIELQRKKIPGAIKLNRYDAEEDSLNAVSEKITDSSKLSMLEKKLAELSEKRDMIALQQSYLDRKFIIDNPGSIAAVSLLFDAIPEFKRDELKFLYDHISKANKESPWGIMIKDELQKRGNGSVGTAGFNFSEKTLAGDTISLNSYRGRYVLLDFWATQCVPCRKALPALKNTYNKYHSKGIEFISISEDGDISKWKDAVTKEGIGIWPQIVSAKGKSISDNYSIRSLPSAILIDPEGKIIRRFTEDDDDTGRIDEVLTKLFAP